MWHTYERTKSLVVVVLSQILKVNDKYLLIINSLYGYTYFHRVMNPSSVRVAWFCLLLELQCN